MYPVLAPRRGAFCFLALVTLAGAASAQAWNDPRSRALVEMATARRVEQLADTGLTDYRADAHGYVTFLAQLGEGFPTPPKIVKADELALEVYWHAPNLSKQRIVGRRDTLLLPTDIQYHRDHLGIVQNNFPNIIRIGEGDEVADVPHPLSPTGLGEYDFAIADSFAIRLAGRDINVLEVKVRPKDDRKPRVIGAVYIDPSGGQVVRMAFNFTRAAFLDAQLEDLAIVLENGLVGTRFWLPRRQEIEIRRSGTWLDYPVRGIIRGRWEISNYRFNLQLPTPLFTGPEIVQAPLAEQQRHEWKGLILDSLPPDVRAASDADIANVQAEARRLVRAQALAHARQTVMSARGLSDFARYNRIEGLAIGDGVTQRFGAGFSVTARGRYGVDDKDVKGELTLAWQNPSGLGLRLFGLRDFRDVGDVQERSTAMNSVAAQEFGSDYTDPYFVRGFGFGLDVAQSALTRWRLDASVERQNALTVHATSVTGHFEPTFVDIVRLVDRSTFDRRAVRVAAVWDRSPSLWLLGTELTTHAELRAVFASKPPFEACPQCESQWAHRTVRWSFDARVERPFGTQRLATRLTGGFLNRYQERRSPRGDEFVYFGGPISAPGYEYHSLWSDRGVGGHVEWQFPIPFFPFKLGRFGRVPPRATLAPFVHDVAIRHLGGCVSFASASAPDFCGLPAGGMYPSVGVGLLTPFELIRVDVARGLRRGRWTFSIDVSRDFWRIL